MKKYLVLIGAAILVMALASPSMAQFKSWGHMEIQTIWEKKPDFNTRRGRTGPLGITLRVQDHDLTCDSICRAVPFLPAVRRSQDRPCGHRLRGGQHGLGRMPRSCRNRYRRAEWAAIPRTRSSWKSSMPTWISMIPNTPGPGHCRYPGLCLRRPPLLEQRRSRA